MRSRLSVPLALAIGGLLGLGVVPIGTVPIGAAPAAAPTGDRDVIVQLFEWNWNSVARECRDFLGPRGYGAVQVSPPQEHVVLPGQGYPWWEAYQPVSYQLTSRKGTRSEFAAMVQTCHGAGVKVYVDAVINHMTGQDAGGVGSAGTQYQHYDYPGVYSGFDFHRCGRYGDDDIRNYQDRWEVQNCELVNLADLKTESDYVRGKIAEYLDDLLSLGVDGFRVDAAKHIPAEDIGAIEARFSRPAYLYQEVIDYGNEPIKGSEYTPNGDVLEFRYGNDLGRVFKTGQLAWLSNFGEAWGYLPSSQAVVFTDNHDTQRTGGSNVLTYRDQAVYALANAFELAWPYGTPKIMSSYAYSDNDQGPPSDSSGATQDATCFDGHWICEHRWQVIANMVGFHNAVRGTGVTHWWSNGGNQIAFGRGNAGYLVINHEGAALTRTFQTGLPAGLYCDVIHGNFTAGSCTGPVYAVDSSGQFTATVNPNDAVALHVGAKLDDSAQQPSAVAVGFSVYATTVWGQNVFVVGDLSQLGSWDPARAVPLSAASYPTWRATVDLPPNTRFEYKYVKKNPDGSVTWESDPNRVAATPAIGSLTLSDTWR